MKTKRLGGRTADIHRAEVHNLTRRWTGTEVLVGLAGHFAGMAADAVWLVVVQNVSAHWFPPSAGAGVNANDGFGQSAATAGRVEVVELALLQALVGHARDHGRAWRAAPWRHSREA